jgi:DNA-binding NarL/FixJ family response regulator
MTPIRILLADDNPIFLKAAIRFLATDPQIKVVGQAMTGREAVRQVLQLQPTLVLMDLAMPEMNGFEATAKIKAQPEAPYIIILTLVDHPEYQAEAERVHADGFIPKTEFGTLLFPLIHTLCNNRTGAETS